MATVTATLDGQTVEVAPGMTILQAAKELGIEIPTLCFVEGFEPVSSCYLCAVQVEGRPNLSPACAMPVADGMVVSTSSDDVRASRKMALELLLSDHTGDCIAPCQATCPAGLDVSGFSLKLAEGQRREAMQVIADRLALPGALGQVCPRLCEDRCRRGDLDESVSIGSLHRFVTVDDLATGEPFVPPRMEASGKTVAMVGAGPAGLAAAFYLLQMGHDCTLLDAQPEAGGMLRYGIPEYRLPNAALDAEIDLIQRLGARFEMNRRWGADFSLSELRAEYDAVFVAIGAADSQGLRCEGEELATSGIEFLEQVAKGQRPPLGDKVVVVGGGDTAMDACRSAVRLGVKTVTVLYRRTRNELPCLLEEVDGAEEEGVEIEYLVAPLRLARAGDGLLELTCQRMQLGEQDASGRRRPVPIPDSEFRVEATTVIAAIGQKVNCELAAGEGLDVTKWGVAADPKTLATNIAGVYCGGDAVSGPDVAVRAVAAGRLAAVSIDQYLKGQPVVGEKKATNILMRRLDEGERAKLYRRIETTPRTPGAQIDLERRTTSFDEIEAPFTAEQAVAEARRCMSCTCREVVGCDLRELATQYDADPYRFAGERRQFSQDLSHPEIIYEPGKCIMCDACVRVAAEAKETAGLALIGRGFQVVVGVPFDGKLSDGLKVVARRCAEVCPTGALALRTDRACDVCGACQLVSCGVTEIASG